MIDFVIVIVSVISLAFNSANLNVIKVLRLLRVIRPLRVISRNDGLKVSIMSLGIALPGIINVMIVSLLFYLIFGVIGINYMKGKFYTCNIAHLTILSS